MTPVYLGILEGFGVDSWWMSARFWPDRRSQHPPSAHLPPLFHLSQEKVRKTCSRMQCRARARPLWLKSPLMCWNLRKQNCFSCCERGDGMSWFGGNRRCCFYFWAKEPGRGNLWEKTELHVCVFTFLMSDRWQCPLFAALRHDLMRVQTGARFKSWTSRPRLFLWGDNLNTHSVQKHSHLGVSWYKLSLMDSERRPRSILLQTKSTLNNGKCLFCKAFSRE